MTEQKTISNISRVTSQLMICRWEAVFVPGLQSWICNERHDEAAHSNTWHTAALPVWSLRLQH